MEFAFTVFGEPTGKGRPRTRVVNGKFAQIYTDEKTQSYEAKVIQSYIDNYKLLYGNEIKPFVDAGQPLTLRICVFIGLNKGDYTYYKKLHKTMLNRKGNEKLHRPAPKKPDIDNIAKIIMDALNGIAYNDDSQITQLHVYKIYNEISKVEITLEKEYER